MTSDEKDLMWWTVFCFAAGISTGAALVIFYFGWRGLLLP